MPQCPDLGAESCGLKHVRSHFHRRARSPPRYTVRLHSRMTLISQAKDCARRIKRDVVAVYFAARDPRTPIVARLMAMAVAAYALSPIDLIPDFIPVVGYLDDLLIVPLGLLLIIRLIPVEVLAASRQKAVATLARPRSRVAAGIVVSIWLLCFAGVAYWWLQR